MLEKGTRKKRERRTAQEGVRRKVQLTQRAQKTKKGQMRVGKNATDIPPKKGG